MDLVIAEKPSVARDLARVLGVPSTGKTHFEGSTYWITWCVGHLVELAEPAEHDPRWKSWRVDTLPMLPEQFQLRPSTGVPGQFRAVRTLLRDRRFANVINACDAGREGELIFRYVYELAGARLPIKRLWVNSLTDEALRKGMAALAPGSRYDNLADAARCRSEADWLVGMNATRAVTTLGRRGAERGTLYSVGRVQTPTLALLVEREQAIENFVPRDFWEVHGTFRTTPTQETPSTSFRATWQWGKRSRLDTKPLAEELCLRCEKHGLRTLPTGPVVEKVEVKIAREPPPYLFDLTSLQRTANRRFGFSAAKTLEVAQSLYEKHKILTYPRTDSRHLSTDVAKELPNLFAAVAAVPDYAPYARPLLASPPKPSRRVVDNAKVSDHHAIVPTGRGIDLARLDSDERKIFDLVVRRFLGAFYPDAEFEDTELVLRVGPGDTAPPKEEAPKKVENSDKNATEDTEERNQPLEKLPPQPDRFFARGRVRLRPGWQSVAGFGDEEEATPPKTASGEEKSSSSEGPQRLPKLREGDRLDGSFASKDGRTRPPPRYTEATLLSAMESAGKTIDDEELKEALRDCGLGTPATRASVIETLLKRGYLARDRKNLVPTALGRALIGAIPEPSLASAELTGRWEARLTSIARGEESRERFMTDIVTYVRSLIEAFKKATPPTTTAHSEGKSPAGSTLSVRCPRCKNVLTERSRDWSCVEGGTPCGFSVPKFIAGRAVSPELAAVLLTKGRTRTLGGFRSREGKAFSAALILQKDGTIAFDFSRSTGDEEKKLRAKKNEKTEEQKAEELRAEKNPGELQCPACKQGMLVVGKRGWGCARWREGCRFVVWFHTAGKDLTVTQLRELVLKGKTRKGKFHPGNGPPQEGRLVLDLSYTEGAARFE